MRVVWRRLLLGLVMLVVACGSGAQEEEPQLSLVPLPASVTRLQNGFTLKAGDTVTSAEPSVAAQLIHGIEADTGLELKLGAKGRIRLDLDAPQAGTEGYELTVDADGARISAATPEGLFRGAQTFRQLARVPAIPGVRVSDRPRFAWRGAMLDVARHFRPVADVKRFVDLMAAYKLNVLHLHLTDDQGWRIAIPGWPGLTGIGAATEVGGGPGGFYTAADYREIVRYAQERFVRVVPEVDVPGHTNAALASHPELNCDGVAPEPYTGIKVGFSALCPGKAETARFLNDVLKELAALTPGHHLHIGGDEVEKLSEREYAQIVELAAQAVTANGKEVVGWQEAGATVLPAGSLVQYWQTNGGPEDVERAVAQGAKVIMSPASRVYLDMKYDDATRVGQTWAGTTEIDDAYDWDPATLIDGIGEDRIEGVEMALWTETVVTMDDLEHLTFPRLPAIAEVAWTPQSERSFDAFAARLAPMATVWDRWGVDYHRSARITWP
ncbi:family 20 glycosylhydrolase [Herbidospora mongoliensis]|uniref:family 20 glycosylhydrolase n=1 Tax=Herbidospora mongoliensis TaxID=688067 RepID=UPI00082ED8EE|nr:family 20 glycosylhydrolase [Herbidospora mongoliensis]